MSRLLVLSLLAVLLVPARAEALLSRRTCRLMCANHIAACFQSSPRPRRCQRAYIRTCRRAGTAACPPPTTTTVTTTTRLATTSTRPVITTTTLLNAAGVWDFDGSLALNDCFLDIDPYVSATVQVTQNGTALSGFVGSVSMHGQLLGPSSWQMLSSVTCDVNCCGSSGIRAEDQIGNQADGALAIVATCGGVTCSVGWVGPMRR